MRLTKYKIVLLFFFIAGCFNYKKYGLKRIQLLCLTDVCRHTDTCRMGLSFSMPNLAGTVPVNVLNVAKIIFFYLHILQARCSCEC